MPRKKKKNISETEKKNETVIETIDGSRYCTSQYQKNIFETIEHTSKNIVVEACAGAGKTTTMIKALDLIGNDKKILFVAFNTDIVKDITKKAGQRENVEIRTLHSLGYKIINKYFGRGKIDLDVYKYVSYIQNNAPKLSIHPVEKLPKKSYKIYTDNIVSIINFARFNLCQTSSDIEEICKIYSIDCIGDEIDVALKALEWGKENTSTVDFTDMIWLPISLDINNRWYKYDFIFLDESQDSNLCEFELMKKCLKMGSRFIAVGDSNQSIYSFAGSSPKVMEKFITMPNTCVLPLSISYRCPHKIIDFVNKKFPNIAIEAEKNAEEGELDYNTKIEDLKDGDCVLCRTNAPLMKVYVELLNNKKSAYILGKEIGNNMIKVINRTDEKFINKDLHANGLFIKLYIDLFNSRNKLMAQANIDKVTASNSNEIVKKYDMISCLEILSEKINSTDLLIKKIKTIFSDKEKDGIKLSTIHKAKGLTLKNVFVCCPSLMPSKQAQQKWEIEQEKNIEYVCYTRAKNKLSFMSEEGFEEFLCGNKESIYNKLKPIEELLEKKGVIKNTVSKVTEKNYTDIINNASKIDIKKVKMIDKRTMEKKQNISEISVSKIKHKKKNKIII